MKKITLICLSLLSLSASAQITYLSTDYAVASEDFTMTRASVASAALLNYSATGANHSWNFANLTAASQSSFAYMNPNNTGYKTSWCFTHGYFFNCSSQFNNNFNLASLLAQGTEVQNYGITNIIEHAKLSSTMLQTKMVGMTAGLGTLAAPVAVDYSSPDVVYQFPMTYGDSYTSDAAFNIDLSNLGVPMSYSATIERSNTIEGWGSLVTPMGTFPDVLKVKTVVVRVDQITLSGITIPIPTTVISYKWFDKNYGVPVLQADGMALGNVFIPMTVSYLDEPQCLQPIANYTVLPLSNDFNPDTQSATVSFLNGSSNYDSLSWNFGDGNTSTATNPSHSYSCPGTYDVALSITNSICSPAVTNTVITPIEITDSQNAFTTAVSVNGAELTALRTLDGTTYQWFDCDSNQLIAGANLQSFTAAASGNYYCQLLTNGCESSTDCVTVDVLSTAAFQSQNSLMLYPNPTNGKLHMSGAHTILKSEVFNMLGIKVADQLDLSSLSSGIYLVKVLTENGEFSRKVVKN